MILITGQAAQGKSTLAAEIVRQPGPSAAWMHLNPSDGDPVNFFHLLVHAVKASRPELNVSVFLKRPAIRLGMETGSGRATELVGVFMDDIVSRAPVRIVLDLFNVGSPENPVAYDQICCFTMTEDGHQTDINPNYLEPIRYQQPMKARLGIEVGF